MSTSKKKNSIKSAVAKKAYNAVNAQLDTLATQLNKLAEDVAAMNKNVWYGGTKATEFYKYANNVYQKIIKFNSGVTTFQTELRAVFSTAAGLTGIQF